MDQLVSQCLSTSTPCSQHYLQQTLYSTKSNGTIWINNAVRQDLRWALDKIKTSSGLFLLESISWPADTAMFTLYCDACPSGMGFWNQNLNQVYFSVTASVGDANLIFYYEAL